VDLQVIPRADIPEKAWKRYRIGRISVHLIGASGERPTDSLRYEDLMIHYPKKLPVRADVLKKSFRFAKGQYYSQTRATRTQERLGELGIFSYSNIQFMQRDSLARADSLDVIVRSALDLAYDSELNLNYVFKDNDYTGPGAQYSVTKRNVFRGGETFSVALKGSYEWQTASSGSAGKLNSYELGLNTSLTFPRVVFPKLGKREYDFPATTKFNLSVSQLNRAHYFKMLSFGGNATYTFQPTRTSNHSVTPFKLTFNTLQSTTADFDSIMQNRPSLRLAMQNQFIASMNYVYTYSNESVRRQRNKIWWQASITSAGNITSGLYALFHKGFNEEKKLMGSVLAQYIKVTNELRYNWNIDRNQSLVSRLFAGVVYAYGGNKIAPYSEQFYVGGANSIRAFTVRTIGPGSYHSPADATYGYMDQTGDMKLEANLEYRFRIIKDLHGAIFLDAGNVWLLRDDAKREGGRFSFRRFADDIALGTGAGLRYDLSFLIVRLDCGVGLHVPYETGKKGYYNIPKFKDSLGIHLAIGYPF
jgi:outer membrane protein assembly factor BamA